MTATDATLASHTHTHYPNEMKSNLLIHQVRYIRMNGYQRKV